MKYRLWVAAACAAVAATASGQELKAPMIFRARTITLPKIEYRETAIRDILDDIAVKSRASDPSGNGVNVLIVMTDQDADRKLTMSVGPATVERVLKLLAAAGELYVRYEPSAIIVEKSKNVVPSAPSPPPTTAP